MRPPPRGSAPLRDDDIRRRKFLALYDTHDDSVWRPVTRLAMLVAGLIREVRSRRREQIDLQEAVSAEVEGIDLPPRAPPGESQSEQRS